MLFFISCSKEKTETITDTDIKKIEEVEEEKVIIKKRKLNVAQKYKLPCTGVITASKLFIREKPSTDSKKLSFYDFGAYITSYRQLLLPPLFPKISS